MKNTLILTLLCLTQFACAPHDWIGSIGTSHFEKFKDARGGGRGSCGHPRATLSKENGYAYLRASGLPTAIEGNFLCEGQTPVLPKDCQGKEFRSVQELEVFWEKHRLPRGLIRFDCSEGIPKVQSHALDVWRQVERENPTCKDPKGNLKPCV